MKKVLVFMLILAITAGVFAQDNVVTIEGEIVTVLDRYTVVRSEQQVTSAWVAQEVFGLWTVGASANLWTELDFLDSTTPVLTAPSFHNRGGDGKVSLKYERPFSNANLTFLVTGLERGNNLGFSVEGDGVEGRYKFKFGGGLVAIGINDPTTDSPIGFTAGDLNGWYKMFGGLIHLMVSIAGNPGGIASYGDVGGGNLGLNINLDTIKFGFVLPNVFSPDEELLKVFNKIKFGIEFNSDIVSIGAWYDNYNDRKKDDGFSEGTANFHFEAGTKISAVDLSLWFDGRDIKSEHDENTYWFGVGVSYDGGTFGASVDTEVTVVPTPIGIDIEPKFWIKVLPDTLYAGIDANFGFGDGVNWKLEPYFAWNFLRSGAKGYGDLNTGMEIRYTVSSDTGTGIDTNKIRFSFKWGL